MVQQAVKDIYGVTDTGGSRYRFQSPALLRLQEAAEKYIENVRHQINNITQLDGRRHVLPSDFRKWKRITGFKINHHRYRQSLMGIFNSFPRTSYV